ncbi:acyltransferase [Pedobacter metabolipauper]|uniref:Transferase family hexapeptide repeat protein n=1 Tax=Pedobacter metabolipauper TaxID=425513 RepID=A0A4R6SVY9_9SPHI|nr:acyltransferase [Pedobacter metabolipauper]TDQ09980.1 transferase family hexapeptide repeat protein [Pedobacter metabolipauper]
MKTLRYVYKRCKQTKSSFVLLLFSYIKYKVFYKKTFFVHHGAKLYGVNQINTNHQLTIGINNTGHSHPSDKTVVNVEGKLNLTGKYSIGRGCRIYIRKNAVVHIGKNGYMNNDTQINISHGLTIGDDTIIAWNCQFLDSDIHHISYPDKKETDNTIHIGNNVWIGCNVHIYKGTTIPDNSIIAADSVVRGIFTTSNSLIGGNPAKVLRSDVTWRL